MRLPSRFRTSTLCISCAALLMASPTAAAQSVVAPDALAPEQLTDGPSGFRPLDWRLPRQPSFALGSGPYVSVQVNVDGNGDDIVGDAANECSIAVNATDPDNLVIGWRQFDSITSSFRQAGWAYSSDGGASWTFPGVLETGVFRSDPVLAADGSGALYYQSLYLDPAGGGALLDLWESTDGGVSWQAPVDMFGGDKNWLALDTSGGPGDGHIYGTWQKFFGCCGEATLTRSTNGGASFEAPVEVDLRPLFGTMNVGPDGELYISGVEGTFFQDFDTFVVSVSTNASNAAQSPTFSGAVVDLGGSMGISSGPNPGGLLGESNVAVDRSSGPTRGNAYMLCSVVSNTGSDPMDVRLSRSVDGGATWSPSVRINDDPTNNGAWQWFGALDVAPNGRIDAIWYDTRQSGADNISRLYYAASYDAGVTWSDNVAVSPAFDSHLGWPQQAKLGDYITIVSALEYADVAYAATFNGGQDVWHVRVFPDCNGNGISDETDLLGGAASDCNTNGIPDACDIAAGTSLDADSNGVPDECQGTFSDLGNGLAGVAGVPLLAGSGTLVGGDPITLSLSDAAPNASTTLVIGLSAVFAPFKGGVLVPAADILVAGLSTDGSGAFALGGTWPAGVPSATMSWFQQWTVDAAGPSGLSASNGLLAITP